MLTPPYAGPGLSSACRPGHQRRRIGSLFSGISSKLVSLWQKGWITLLLSREILDEYLGVLSYPKFELSERNQGIDPGGDPSLCGSGQAKRRLCVVQSDPSDNKFIECAVAGKARVIISGDKDLLSLGRYRQIRILSPAKFLADNAELRDS